MRICYASRVRSEAISQVISSRFVRLAHHSERIFQSPRFMQTGLSILRFQKEVTFPQPPWRPLQAAVQKLITTTLFSLERLFWIKNQFSNSKNRSQTQILEKKNATSKIFSTHCGMAWTLVGQLKMSFVLSMATLDICSCIGWIIGVSPNLRLKWHVV